MKIVVAHFQAVTGVSGGMERVLCDFSNAMTEFGHEVHLMVYDLQSGIPFYPLNDGVHLWNLRKFSGEPDRIPAGKKVSREVARFIGGEPRVCSWYDHYRAPYLLPAAKKLLDEIKPDIIVVQWYTSNYLVKLLKPYCPIVTWFHNRPTRLFRNMSGEQKKAIGESTLIQVLTPDYQKEMHRTYPQAKIICIPNEVPQLEEQADLKQEKDRFHIITVGRLNKDTKRQHILIDAFSKVAAEFPNWDLEIWGKGDSKYVKYLRNQIQQKQLEKRVFLRGVTTNILNENLHSDIFAFPSDHEGFPLAMTEAMSVGLPVVAFASCSGVNEIVKNGETGFLVSDGVDDFAQKLKLLMENRELRIKMGNAAKQDMKQYAPEKIWKQWERVLLQCVNKGQK